jgi:pyruvate decarboxylase
MPFCCSYTIERIIHSAHQSYNDVVPFNYEHMLGFFNMPPVDAAKNFHRVSTRAEMESVLLMECIRSPQAVQVVEVIMDKVDVPWRLSAQVAMRKDEADLRAMTEAGFKVHQASKGKSIWH